MINRSCGHEAVDAECIPGGNYGASCSHILQQFTFTLKLFAFLVVLLRATYDHIHIISLKIPTEITVETKRFSRYSIMIDWKACNFHNIHLILLERILHDFSWFLNYWLNNQILVPAKFEVRNFKRTEIA